MARGNNQSLSTSAQSEIASSSAYRGKKLDYSKIRKHFDEIVAEKSKLANEAKNYYFKVYNDLISEGKVEPRYFDIIGNQYHDLLRDLYSKYEKAENVRISAVRRRSKALKDATRFAYSNSNNPKYKDFLTDII